LSKPVVLKVVDIDPLGVNWTIQRVDKYSQGRMGVTEWPGGQRITAGVYMSMKPPIQNCC